MRQPDHDARRNDTITFLVVPTLAFAVLIAFGFVFVIAFHYIVWGHWLSKRPAPPEEEFEAGARRWKEGAMPTTDWDVDDGD